MFLENRNSSKKLCVDATVTCLGFKFNMDIQCATLAGRMLPHRVLQRQKTVIAYLKRKQLLPVFALQYRLI